MEIVLAETLDNLVNGTALDAQEFADLGPGLASLSEVGEGTVAELNHAELFNGRVLAARILSLWSGSLYLFLTVDMLLEDFDSFFCGHALR